MKSMYNTVKKIALVALVGWLGSCSTDLYQEPEVPELGGGETVLPGGFDFSMVRSLTLKVNINDEYSGLYDYRVQIFDVNPFTTKDARALYTGIARGGKAYTFEEISLSQSVENLYIVQVDPRQGQTLKTISLDATSAQYECDFGLQQFATTTKAGLRGDDNYKTPTNAIALTSADQSGILDLKNKENVIRNGVSISADKLICPKNDDVMLYVEGTLILSKSNPFESNTDLTIVLQPGGRIILELNILNGVNSQNSELKLIVNTDASLDWNAASVNDIDIVNKGTFKIKELSLNEKGCDLTNECNMEVGTLLIGGHQDNSDSEGIEVDLKMNSMLKCETVSCKNVEFELDANAIFCVTDNIEFDKSVSIGGEDDGKGHAYCEFGSISQNSNGSKNNVTLEHNLKVFIKTPYSGNIFTLGDGASFVNENATPQIPAGDCTGEGNETEDLPNPMNPSYPIELPTGALYYTFAMEDNWPAVGDYDMNDLVLGIKDMQASVDRNDQVTKFSFIVELLATGATKRIGAGVQFEEIAANQIASVRTPEHLGTPLYFDDVTKIENNNDNKAVLPLFEDAHFLINLEGKYTMTNTYNSAKRGIKKILMYEIAFSKPVSKSAVDIKNMNFFIAMGGDAQSRIEVHIAGYNPTSRMKQKVNGYITEDNMPYGIMVPYQFAYPAETKKIMSAYTQFADWARSGGKSNVDWYKNPTKDMIFNLESLGVSN